MPLIAIIPSGSGVVEVTEYREATDTTSALVEFLASRGLDPASTDFIAHDPSWTAFPGGVWSYDHSTSALLIPLKVARRKRFKQFDARTRTLCMAGMEYPAASGDFFSICAPDMNDMVGFYLSRNDVSYPVEWEEDKGVGVLSFADAPAVKAFYLAAVAAAQAHRDSGEALKVTVRAAATVAAIDAVVDNR